MKGISETEGRGLPDRERAMAILTESEELNPGPWKAHSVKTAEYAEKIAAACKDMNPEKAYVLGLLHDIGRRFGKGQLRHVTDGYLYMKKLGYSEAAAVCLTHSFPQHDIQEYIGKFDVTREELELLTIQLDLLEYTDYDRLIQLCDAIALPDGPADMEARMDSIAVRYGYYPPQKRQSMYRLRRYFEEKMGKDLYKVVNGCSQ